MTQINNVEQYNNIGQKQRTNQKANVISRKYVSNRQTKTINDVFEKQHKKNGVFERFFNSIKNMTGLGVGSKKVKKTIAQAQKGQISSKEASKVIDKYRKSQANSEQAMGDVLSVGAAGITYFGLRKPLKMFLGKVRINEDILSKNGKKVMSLWNLPKSLASRMLKITKSNKKAEFALAGTAALIGGLTKYWALKFNRAGSDEFKVNKKDYKGPQGKIMYKYDKKEAKYNRRIANLRNFVSGAINGFMMPLSLVGGAIVGVPSYIIGNSLNRYFVGSHENNKSLNGYVDNLKDSALVQTGVVAATAIPLAKHAQFSKVFDTNLSKAINKLKDANLVQNEFKGRTVYNELDEILMGSSEVNSIVHNSKLSVNDKIQALTKENLFAVKFKQISGDGSVLTRELRENCPPSRTLEEAQKYISKNLGDGYDVSKLLGVGTVAETYLAKSSDGKEVCIKILKDGITKEKIQADKEKFVNIIKNLADKTQDEKDYLLKNVDDLAEGIQKEVDFANEMNAAKELLIHTKVADVVKPIEFKNGVYVMEKAKGISLSSLVELNSAKKYKEALEKASVFGELFEPPRGTKLYNLLKDTKTKEEKIKLIDEYTKKIEARTPEFGDISLNQSDFKALITEYQRVLVEQFNKVEKGGKVLHADIHPGNIFIDVNALRNRNKGIANSIKNYYGRGNGNKIFTLIDTGNTVKMDVDQSLRAMNLTSYIKNGNVKDIVDYVLDGAFLGGKTKAEATEIMEKELKQLFFDNKTKLGTITNENLLTLTSNIMRKHGITPGDTQLNLNKARNSANNSLNELYDSWGVFLLDGVKSTTDVFKALGKAAKDAFIFRNQNKNMQAMQEKLNLNQLSVAQRLKQKNNPNMLKTNSEDYLTYKLKQGKLDASSLNQALDDVD